MKIDKLIQEILKITTDLSDDELSMALDAAISEIRKKKFRKLDNKEVI